MTEPARFDLIGVPISAIDLPSAVQAIAGAIAARRRGYVSTCPVYTVMRAKEDAAVGAAISGAFLATPDGMPVVWAMRLLGARGVGRVYGPDLMLALCECGLSEGWRHFFLGGAPGVPESLAENLRVRFPDLKIAGMYSPPFRPLARQEDIELVERLNAMDAEVVWVGLGSPKQDLWMAAHRERLNAPMLIDVGAAFEFLAGRMKQAPRWMQRSGLEWLFRFAQEPRRLARRYVVYNPRFVWAVARQWARRDR